MFKHSLPSIEQFAAYLDGNLSQSEMQQFSQLAKHDSVLNQLLDASDVVDDAIAGFADADLQLPPEIANQNFELPKIEESDNFMHINDRFAENDSLYQQEGSTAEEQLFAKIADEMDPETGDVGDLDDWGIDIGDDDFDADLLEI